MQDKPQLTAQTAVESHDAHPVEVEVKLGADPAALAAVYASPVFTSEASRPKKLRSVYFDTPAFGLQHAGIVLRVRSGAGGRFTMAMKFDVTEGSALFHRHEIEVEAGGAEPDIALFGKKTSRRLKRLIQGLPLEQKFETQVTRRTRTAVSGASLIEVAFDEGVIALPDGRKKALCELELELKSGSSTDLFALARRLAAEHGLRLDVTSKSEKGFALLRAEAASPVKAQATSVREGTVVQDILSGTLTHFAGNWEALREGDDAESIHQLRVALRRMRTAFRMLGHVMPSGDITALRDDAGRIGAAFGRARDLDALIGLLSGEALRAACGAGLDPLVAEARRQRAKAFAAARAYIDSQEVTDFVLRAESFAAENPVLPLPAEQAAAGMLEWLHRRVLKRGRKLATQTDQERHRLRIALKDLRYGIDMLSGLFKHGGRSERMARAAAALQDFLGAHNDAVTVAALARELAAPLGADGAAAAGFAAGWLARDAREGASRLKDAWKGFRKCSAFWGG